MARPRKSFLHQRRSLAMPGLFLLLACICYIITKKLRQPKQTSPQLPRPPLLQIGYNFFLGHIIWYFKGLVSFDYKRHKLFFDAFRRTKMPIFDVSFGPSSIGTRITVINDSQLAQEVLTSPHFDVSDAQCAIVHMALGKNCLPGMKGEQWRVHRRLMSACFHRHHFEFIVQVIIKHCRALLSTMGANVNPPTLLSEAKRHSFRGEPNNIVGVHGTRLIGNLSFSITAEAAFNFHISEKKISEVCKIRSAVKEVFSFVDILAHQVSPALWKFLNPKKYEHFVKTRQYILDEVLEKTVIRRRRSLADGCHPHHQDFLSLIINSTNKVGQESGVSFTKQEILDEGLVVLAGGFDAASSMTMWLLYYLAIHPSIQNEVYQEVSRVLGDRKEEELTVSDFDKMTYLEGVVKEVQRLRPPNSIVGRQAVKDTEIRGYLIKKGTFIFISNYSIHHSPQEWNDPEDFRPLRWERKNGGCKKNNKYAFLTFGGGRRHCLGQPLVTQQTKIIIAMLTLCYQMQMASDDIRAYEGALHRPQQLLMNWKPRPLQRN